MVKGNGKWIAMAIMLAFLVGGAVGWWLKPCPAVRYVKVPAGADAILVNSVDTVERWHVVQVPKAVRVNTQPRVIYDSVTVYDTTATRFTCLPYLAIDTALYLTTQDTVITTFRHPDQIFHQEFRRRPDSIRTRFITTDIITTVDDTKRWGIGVSVGYGLQVDMEHPLQSRTGPSLQVGVQYNVFEF